MTFTGCVESVSKQILNLKEANWNLSRKNLRKRKKRDQHNPPPEEDIEELIDVDAQEDSDGSSTPKNADTKPVEKNTKDKGIICPFYKENKCKFGISGKGCKHFHPKVCPKIIQHGLGGRLGCVSGCKKFHPKMCRTSLNKRECFRESCQFSHVKGTKRQPNNTPNSKDYRFNPTSHGNRVNANQGGSRFENGFNRHEKGFKTNQRFVQQNEPRNQSFHSN